MIDPNNPESLADAARTLEQAASQQQLQQQQDGGSGLGAVAEGVADVATSGVLEIAVNAVGAVMEGAGAVVGGILGGIFD